MPAAPPLTKSAMWVVEGWLGNDRTHSRVTVHAHEAGEAAQVAIDLYLLPLFVTSVVMC